MSQAQTNSHGVENEEGKCTYQPYGASESIERLKQRGQTWSNMLSGDKKKPTGKLD